MRSASVTLFCVGAVRNASVTCVQPFVPVSASEYT